MAGETTITLIGNLTADPELRFTLGCSGRELHRRIHTMHVRSSDQRMAGRRCDAPQLCGVAPGCGERRRIAAEGNAGHRGKAGCGRAAMRPVTANGAPYSRSMWMRSARALRYATAKVTRNASGSGQGGARPPAGGLGEDPWTSGTSSAAGARSSGSDPLHPRAMSPRSDT